MFRVLKLRLYNFKGFRDEEFLFNKTRTILGGPNGYGKTSIFDALELLFTGTIKRMQDYRPGHDDRTTVNQDYKPLVYDTSINTIIIEAVLQLNERQVVIRRSAEQERMKNPVDFNAFSMLQYLNPLTGAYEDVDTNDELTAVFSPLASQYTFLNYLTQEEANRFLKCKESDRKQQINSLFKTEGFDVPINRLIAIRGEVNAMAQNINSEKTRLEEDINKLQTSMVTGNGNSIETEYIQLFNKAFDWDKVNPQISHESFSSLLSVGGVLDQLQYYCQNKTAYHWFELNEKLNDILEADNLKRLAVWLRWNHSEPLLSQYNDYIVGFKKKWELLSLSTVSSFAQDYFSQLPAGVINSKIINDVVNQISTLQDSVQVAGSLQRAYADMVGARNVAEKTLTDVQSIVHVNNCPLCGADYDSEETLLHKVQDFGQQLTSTLEKISEGVSTSVALLKSRMEEVIVKPVDTYYQTLGVSGELLDYYRFLDKSELMEQYSFLTHQLSFTYEISGDEKEIGNQIMESINGWRTTHPMELPEGFDAMRLRRVYSSYGRYLLPGLDNEASIEQKRQYLTQRWNAISSQLMAEKMAALTLLKYQYDRLNKRSKLLKQTCDSIKVQKNAYLSKMVSQIETLFYIYTGRIMQDGYYGRGCYLKYNQTNSNVLFTSGSPQNDVDAIYKMSSGQLVSISVVFMLTVNKLYSNQSFIAIDDPVQTIDDLNLWGLMETLRHDFMDSTILLSTHERDFGLLLTDKFSKVGLETEYVDMSMHH